MRQDHKIADKRLPDYEQLKLKKFIKFYKYVTAGSISEEDHSSNILT